MKTSVNYYKDAMKCVKKRHQYSETISHIATRPRMLIKTLSILKSHPTIEQNE